VKNPASSLLEANLPDSARTLDLTFARDIERMITLRDVEALSDLAGRIRTRRTQLTSVTATPTLDTAIHDQLK
jgi:hypothetical protein